MPSFSQVTAALAAVASTVQAVKLTLNDYEVLKNAVNNPPACGVPYPNVDVARITAMSGIGGNFDPNCGGCINVKGSTGSKHLLVVDSCVGAGLGDHLDISTTAGPDVVGSDTGNHEVTWEWVDVSNCAGIWDGQGMDNVPNGSENWGKLKNLASGGGSQEQPAQEQPAQEQPAQEQPAQEQPAQEQPAQEQPATAPATSAAQEAPAVFVPISSAPAVQEQPSAPAPAPAPAPTSSAEAPVVESPIGAPIIVGTPTTVPTSEPVAPEAPSSTAVALGEFHEETPIPTPSPVSSPESSFCAPVSTVTIKSYGTVVVTNSAPTVESRSSTVEYGAHIPLVPTPSTGAEFYVVPTPSSVADSGASSTAIVSPGMFFENNSALSLPSTFATAASTAVTHVPSPVASPTIPTVSPPAFTGAASRSSATLPVLSVFAAVLALWI